jgi:hypothetical protein
LALQPSLQGTHKPLLGTVGPQGRPAPAATFPSLPAANHDLVALLDWQTDIYWGGEESESPDQDMAGGLPEEEEDDALPDGGLEAMEVQEGGTYFFEKSYRMTLGLQMVATSHPYRKIPFQKPGRALH